ncbi:DUF4112 domain-containing protein [Pontibacter diazotrophicus]|uniref:DUF4112 domain-containing protein n=1 Tax=Pontibacter diazotrophicus TaxID=1400979 RepID=A0A3D8L6Q5_9BACT|nr:DUF4112 domain-containing protein [Pontibacter diazotrophicus]RDV13003.1 DUF4112 domain-containing protein [Pontibacter diazotrophicus]
MAQENLRYTRTPQTERLKWVEYVARLMDNQFTLPGTKFRFGLDPILGLLPVAGDLASFAMSATIILTIARHGASGKLVVLMLINLAIDTVVGSVPILGNLFDFAFKANERNVRLLRRHYEEGKYQGSGKGIFIMAVVSILVVLMLLLWAMWELIEWLYQLIF